MNDLEFEGVTNRERREMHKRDVRASGMGYIWFRDPFGVEEIRGTLTRGIVVVLLNPRLISGNPSGCVALPPSLRYGAASEEENLRRPPALGWMRERF